MTDAITKLKLDNQTLRAMTEKGLGITAVSFDARELQGGNCSSVYDINIDQHELILKVGTLKSVQIMRHERNYVPNEAEMLKIMSRHYPDLPIPKLIFYDDSLSVCPVPYFFMTKIPGQPLLKVSKDLTKREYGNIKFQVAKVTRKINDILAPSFGVPALPETYTAYNSKFVYTLFDMLLKDARDKDVPLPNRIKASELRTLIKKAAPILDLATGPVFAPTDTWDGNVMVQKHNFSGLVDFAEILYGDPLITHDFHDPSVGKVRRATLRAYGRRYLSKDEKERILIYRLWQNLGMILEPFYRQYSDPHMYDWVKPLFAKDFHSLKRALKI